MCFIITMEYHITIKMTDTESNGTKTMVSYLKHRCKQWNQSIFCVSYVCVCGSVVVVIMNMCTITYSSQSISKKLFT